MRGTAEPAAADGPPAIVPAPRLAPTEASRRWAALLQQIFEVDPLACPSCHGAMRIVACITQTSVIDQILTHLRTRASREAHAGPRSPPSTRAPRAGARHAPHARPPTLRRSTDRRPAPIEIPIPTAGDRPRTTTRAHRVHPPMGGAPIADLRGGLARLPDVQRPLAGSAIAPYVSPDTRSTPIEFPSGRGSQ